MEETALTPIRKVPIVQQVINKITDEIISGRLKPGDKLPTELELMETLGCSRNTVREAMRTLIAYGVVEIRRPEGTFVCNKASKQMLSPRIYQAILGSKEASGDIVAFRRIIETGIYQLLMHRGVSNSEMERLRALNAELDAKILNSQHDILKVVEADMHLHTAIAALTENQLVVAVHDLLAELTWNARFQTIQKIYARGDINYLIDVHAEALRFIEGKSKMTLDELLDYTFLDWQDAYHWVGNPKDSGKKKQ